jgi:hypothetical protein
MIMLILLIVVAGPAAGQRSRDTKRDSVMLAAVKTLQVKLGLSDEVTGKIRMARTSMIEGLDSLEGQMPADSKTRGSVAVRLQQQYRSLIKGVLTADQWTRYQQMERAALDSFYVRMRAKGLNVKSQDQGH